MIPNLFIPDYGSRQTSAIYIRGIGSRIGTPSVGLMVDGIPYYDKSAFDFSLAHAESIEVARGAQNTLYGRNTMGGIVKVSTRSPFRYEGTDIHLGYATGNHQRRLSLTHYHHPVKNFAFSVGAFYEGDNGFFRNSLTDKMVDGENAGGLRLRGIYRATDSLTLDVSLHYEFCKEGAYPYYYTGVTKGEEKAAPYIGHVTNNLEGSYRRHIMNAGVRTEYRMKHATLHAVTAYQHITDRMFMDQDFMASDIYSLEQRQGINVLSQELVLKSREKTHYQGLFGTNVFYQWQKVNAPITFRTDGVAMLNSLINTQANSHLPVVESGPMKMAFQFQDNINGPQVAFANRFCSPTLGAALFHQSDFKNLFGVKGLGASLGLRLDYERIWLDYATGYDFNHEYALNGHLTMPGMERDIKMVDATRFFVSNHSLQGKECDDHLQLLPKFSVQYAFQQGSVYASVSRGYRSGGYNVQNISELLRSQMQSDMMRQVRDATLPVLEKQPAVPQETKEKVAGILNRMAQQTHYDVAATCEYRPEYAWNYEVGTRLNLLGSRLTMDVSAFLSNVHDLQLSQMSTMGLGRVITNAGRSRSAGLEASITARPTDCLTLMASYGYTHATFRNYQTLMTDGSTLNLRGNYVPYMPRHTFFADAAYAFPLRHRTWRTLTLGANVSGAGRIFWDEMNSHVQNLYALLGARVQLSSHHIDLQLWGKNLTNTRYNTFWFASAGRGYEQHGRPLQVGIDLQWRF